MGQSQGGEEGQGGRAVVGFLEIHHASQGGVRRVKKYVSMPAALV